MPSVKTLLSAREEIVDSTSWEIGPLPDGFDDQN